MTTGEGNTVFVDTNVLVFATVEDAPLCAVARDTLEKLRVTGAELWISRQVIREFLAVLTRPQTYVISLTKGEIIDGVRAFAAQLKIAEDGPEVTEHLLEILEQIPVGGRQLHDANIVATMRAHDIRRLLTHNPQDFTRYTSLISVTPLVP